MDDFGLYFNLGWRHITDLSGLDHILFVAALCIRYQYTDWRKVLLLVTAFTIGHSLTLALSAVNLVRYNTRWIEFLIPLTICITAFTNLFVEKFSFKSKYPLIYFLALFFGLVHGLGFSSYLKSILGRSSSIIVQLFAFNVGLEAGQLLIVAAMLLLSGILIFILKFNRREYLLIISSGIFFLALQMAVERYPR